MKDKLKVTLLSKLRVEGHFMVTQSYGSNNYQKAIMEPQTDLMIGFPYRVYLNFISTGAD